MDKKKILAYGVFFLITLAFLLWEIYDSLQNGRQTASNGQFILDVLGIAGGALIGWLFYENRKTRVFGILAGILVFLFFVWLSTTQFAFIAGLIVTGVISVIMLIFLFKNLFIK